MPTLILGQYDSKDLDEIKNAYTGDNLVAFGHRDIAIKVSGNNMAGEMIVLSSPYFRFGAKIQYDNFAFGTWKAKPCSLEDFRAVNNIAFLTMIDKAKINYVLGLDDSVKIVRSDLQFQESYKD